MADNNDTEWSVDVLQTIRNAHTRVAGRLFGDQRGRDWLDGEYGRLDTTLRSATRDDLLTVGRKLIGLMEAARGKTSDSITVEPTAEPEYHDVLKEIAEEKITREQVEHLETLATQYRLGPMEFAALVRNYGAEQIVELKDVDYSHLVRDIYRTGALIGGRKKSAKQPAGRNQQ